MSYISADQIFRQAAVLQRSGRLAEAAGICRSAVFNFPEDIRILNLIAILDLQQGMIQDSLGWMERSLTLEPRQADTLSNYAIALEQLSRPADALAAIDKAIALQPNHTQAHGNRCNFLNMLGRFEEALVESKKAFACGGKTLAAYVNRGNALRGLMRLEEALADFDAAREMAPRSVLVLNNRGHVLQMLGRTEDAQAAFTQVIALNPRFPDGYVGHGNTLYDQHRYADAIRDYDRALALNPSYVSARWNKALATLVTGDFASGWPLFEARRKSGVLSGPARNFPQPQWCGEGDLKGKSILIYAEQGLGDTAQFCRYIPHLAEMGASVVFEVQPELKALISTLPGDFQLFARGESLPETDFQCPLMSLPLAFRTTPETIPGQTPYLHADPQKVADWAAMLGQKTQPRIGLCWSGNVKTATDRSRSVPAAFLQPLMAFPAAFHCLQKDIRPADAGAIAPWPVNLHTDALGDFSDTAALIENLDLVITVDTSVAHVAGALGKAVWLLLPWAGEWRWLSARADSPWYPGMRLFRQKSPGDWAGVISAVGEALKTL